MRSFLLIALFSLLVLSVSAHFELEELDNEASLYSREFSLMATGSGISYTYSITTYPIGSTTCSTGTPTTGATFASGTCAPFSGNYSARIDCTTGVSGLTYSTNQETGGICPALAGSDTATSGSCYAGSNTGVGSFIVTCVATNNGSPSSSSSTGSGTTVPPANYYYFTATNDTQCTSTSTSTSKLGVNTCYYAGGYSFSVTCPTTSNGQVSVAYSMGNTCPATTSSTALNQQVCYNAPTAIANSLPFRYYSVYCDNYVAPGSASNIAPSMFLALLVAFVALLF